MSKKVCKLLIPKWKCLHIVQFASLNDKRYYFLDGIVPLPYGHPLLSKIHQIKKTYPKIYKIIEQEKNNELKIENEVDVKHERLWILRSIDAQPKTYYKLDSNVKVNQKGSFDFTTTRDNILNSKWLWNVHYNSNNFLICHMHCVSFSKCKITYTTQQNLAFLGMWNFTIQNRLNNLKIYFRFPRCIWERLLK